MGWSSSAEFWVVGVPDAGTEPPDGAVHGVGSDDPAGAIESAGDKSEGSFSAFDPWPDGNKDRKKELIGIFAGSLYVRDRAVKPRLECFVMREGGNHRAPPALHDEFQKPDKSRVAGADAVVSCASLYREGLITCVICPGVGDRLNYCCRSVLACTEF